MNKVWCHNYKNVLVAEKICVFFSFLCNLIKYYKNGGTMTVPFCIAFNSLILVWIIKYGYKIIYGECMTLRRLSKVMSECII